MILQHPSTARSVQIILAVSALLGLGILKAEGLNLDTANVVRFDLEFYPTPAVHPSVRAVPLRSLAFDKGDDPRPVLPGASQEGAQYARWKTPLSDEGFLWVVLWNSGAEGSTDLLVVDSDGDGELRDETPVRSYSSGGGFFDFDSVQITATRGQTESPYEVVFSTTTRDGGPVLFVRPGGWYRKSVQLAGQRLHCAVIDKNANGVFNDASIDFADADLIQVSETPGIEVALVGRYVQVAGDLLRLSITPDGAHIELQPAGDVARGTLLLPSGLDEVVLGGENGMFTLPVEDGRAYIPEGDYRVYQWTLAQKDTFGDRWKLVASSRGNPGIVKVVRDQEVTVPIDTTLVSRLRVIREDSGYALRHAWRGSAGEHIQLSRNNAGIPAPAVRIQDGSHERATTRQFGSGCPGGVCTLRWQKPVDWSELPVAVAILPESIPFPVQFQNDGTSVRD